MTETDIQRSVETLLQFAFKAKKIVLGHDPLLREIAKKNVCLILLANDLSQNSINSISKANEYKQIKTINFGDKELYYKLFGKYIGIIGIIDENFKKGIEKHITLVNSE